MNRFMFQNYDLVFKKKSNRHFALYKRERLFKGKSKKFFLKFVYLCTLGARFPLHARKTSGTQGSICANLGKFWPRSA